MSGLGSVQEEKKDFLNMFKGLFYKLVYYSIRKCSYAWPLFKLSLVSFFPLFKHLHSPLCACSQDRNLLRDSSKTVSS